MGKVESHELVMGGSAIPVTNDNKYFFILFSTLIFNLEGHKASFYDVLTL